MVYFYSNLLLSSQYDDHFVEKNKFQTIKSLDLCSATEKYLLRQTIVYNKNIIEAIS